MECRSLFYKEFVFFFVAGRRRPDVAIHSLKIHSVGSFALPSRFAAWLGSKRNGVRLDDLNKGYLLMTTTNTMHSQAANELELAAEQMERAANLIDERLDDSVVASGCVADCRREAWRAREEARFQRSLLKDHEEITARKESPYPFGSTGKADAQHPSIACGLPKRCRIWLGRIIAAGRRGVTLDELSAQSGIAAHRFSGRITELKKRGLIEHLRDRRPTRRGGTAAVIVATEQAHQPGLQEHSDDPSGNATEQQPSELPDAITNTAVPSDESGSRIAHGQRYMVPGIGLVEVYYEVEEDLFYVFRPRSPEKRQPINLLPPQLKPWHKVAA